MLSTRARWSRAFVPVVAALLVGAAWQGQAPPAGAVVRQTPPTTTPNLLQDLLNQLIPTTTVPPPPPPPPAEAPVETPTDAAPPLEGPLPSDSTAGSQGLPALSSGNWAPGPGRSTQPLLDALGVLRDIGFTEEEAMTVGMGRFPVGGLATYTDGFGEPRGDHIHQGVDVLAAGGTPVRAPGDGVVSFSEAGGYGKVAAVTVGDGTVYFMAHMSDFAEGLASGAAVTQGQTVAYVGATGNATGTHVHLEVRPGGGGTVDPKPFLDGWIDEAVAAVPAILALFAPNDGSIPRALLAAGFLRRFDPTPAGLLEEQSRLLSAASADSRTDAEAWLQARQLAVAVISPLTPAPLNDVLVGGGD